MVVLLNCTWGVCKAKNRVILGCPAQRAESLVRKEPARYSPRARAGLFPSPVRPFVVEQGGLLSLPSAKAPEEDPQRVPDGTGLLRASDLGVGQDRVRTALRRM